MPIDERALTAIIAKDEIRELVQLYSRAADRRDRGLLRSLYTKNGIDNHGDIFCGTADELMEYLDKPKAVPLVFTGHFIANHLIAIESEDEAQGEVYAIGYHHFLSDEGSATEEIMFVRYLDQYAREDGRWRIARRDVTYDHSMRRPITEPKLRSDEDLSYQLLTNRLFARGPRS